MPRIKTKSRTARWQEAVAEARSALDVLTEARDKVVEAIGAIRDVQSEYEDWQSNLPENLTDSALGQKLAEVVDLDLEPDEDDLGAMVEAVDNAEGIDLPRGFGRD